MDVLKDKSPTLTTTHYGTPAVCYSAQLGMLERFGGHFYEEVTPTLQADATGDNKPVVVCAFDAYNMADTGSVAKTLNSAATDTDHIPIVCIEDSKHSVVYGCDLGATRDVGELFIEECSKTLTNGSCPGHHNHVVICIEGNGSRPSHQGDGYKESEQMYTMNTTEVHAVCYAEKRFFDWEEDDRSVTIRNNGGSYGGGSEVLIVEETRKDDMHGHCRDLGYGIPQGYEQSNCGKQSAGGGSE